MPDAKTKRRKKSAGFTIKFGDDRRSQAAATHLLDALMGNKPSPTCATCGGITIDSGPAAGRCDCKKAIGELTPCPQCTEGRDADGEVCDRCGGDGVLLPQNNPVDGR